jgi:DNA-binding transcriptional regulator YiaG
MSDATAHQLINDALNAARRRWALTSDRELAAMLKVAPKTISLWRNRKSLSKAALILVQLVALKDEPPNATHAEPVTPS